MSYRLHVTVAGVLAISMGLAGCAAAASGGRDAGSAATSARAMAGSAKPRGARPVPTSKKDLPPRNACPPGPVPAPPAVPAPVATSPPDRVLVVNNKVSASAPAGARYTLSVIDPASRTVAGTVPVGNAPHHIYPVPGENEAYVTHFTGCALDVVNLNTDKVIGTVHTRYGPRHLAFSPHGRYAYVIDYYDATLSVIDTRTNRTVAEVPTGPYPNYPLASRNGRYVFVVNSGADTVTVLSAHAPFRVVATITVGRGPFSLAQTPDGRTVAVANTADNTLSLIDTHTLHVIATVPIRRPGQRDAVIAPRVTQKLNVRIAPGGRYAWVGDQFGADWAVINLPRRRLVATYPAGTGADILFLINRGPMAGQALGTARYAARLSVLAPSRPAITGSVTTVPGTRHPAPPYLGASGPPGAGPHVLALSPSGSTAYVTDRPGGTVSVLSLRGGRPAVAATIPVGMYPDGIAYIHYVHGTGG